MSPPILRVLDSANLANFPVKASSLQRRRRTPFSTHASSLAAADPVARPILIYALTHGNGTANDAASHYSALLRNVDIVSVSFIHFVPLLTRGYLHGVGFITPVAGHDDNKFQQ